jgi:glycosyltransferase involved in cell wall biosynthesis
MDQLPFFSIIMPAYNAREHISRPLMSIALQLFRDFEFIIVDDCSTEPWKDAMFDFLWLEPAIIQNAANLGPGRARQAGLDAARGEYVVFIDADDYFMSPLTLQTVHSWILHEQRPDIYATQFIEVHGTTVKKTHDPDDIGWVHGKFYRREFLLKRNIRFPEIRYTEDYCFNMVAFPLAERVVYNNFLESYLWTKNPKSIVNSHDYVPAIMAHDYPEGILIAFRKLTAFVDETRQVGFLENSLDETFVKNISLGMPGFIIGNVVFLYLYFKAIESRDVPAEQIKATTAMCQKVIQETHCVDHLNAIKDKQEWYSMVQAPVGKHFPTVLLQEPTMILDESFFSWLERMLGDGTHVRRRWDE